MAELTLTNADLSTLDVDALVVGAVRTADTVTLVGADTLPEDVRTRLVTAAKTLALSGAADEVRRLPADPRLKAPVLVITGLGDAAGAGDPEVLRRAAGAATRELVRVPRVAVSLPAADDASLAAVAEGALIGSYAFDTYRTPDEPPTAAVVVVTPLAGSAPAEAVATRARVVAQAVHTVRDLVNTAPNDLFPAAFADRAKAEAKSAGIKATVLDEKALASGGYGGLVNVGKGSERGPRLVKVVYAPAKPAARVALVGKGITFDSGGVSIKPAKGMEAMKSDMAGAAAVLATVVAAATLELSVAVTGYLCLAENMPSGTAQRPSDVISIRGGTTVEVLNTDAEGRLVLADGLVSAREDGADLILDIATLTGAQVVALGDRVSAVMGTDDVRADVVDAARASGEQFWPMPLPTELRPSLDSPVADLANIGSRAGGMLTAGLFLKEFVEDTPWAHLDIAGPAYNEGAAHGYTGAGGTGVGVRTMLALLEARAQR